MSATALNRTLAALFIALIALTALALLREFRVIYWTLDAGSLIVGCVSAALGYAAGEVIASIGGDRERRS